jgi:hypothetical protein
MFIVKYDEKTLLERAKKFNRRSDLKKFDNKTYQALHRRGLLDKACVDYNPSATEAYSFEEIEIEAKKYNSKMDFRRANLGMYDVAYRRGILSIVCSHMPENMCYVTGKKNPKAKWTDVILNEIAQKYIRKIDFLKKEPGAYASAYINGNLDKICSHMSKTYHEWSDQEIQRVALLCRSRGEMQKKFSRAYQAAREKGELFLNNVCSHMKIPKNTSLAEIEILDIVKLFFPEAKKLVRSKVSIEDKPFIKSFDIDIYVKSLNLGIEYDGTRYHSFEYMRKDGHKKLWSDDDIRNYHKIKDSWFASKGIQILHIKEEDWNLDKESCIQKCLEFLSVETQQKAA